VPVVGAFETDVPLGVKILKAIADPDDDFTSASLARDLLLAFDNAKSCRGCGSINARKRCIGCWDADRTKVRYCSGACQLMHWKHPSGACHKDECGSRAAPLG